MPEEKREDYKIQNYSSVPENFFGNKLQVREKEFCGTKILQYGSIVNMMNSDFKIKDTLKFVVNEIKKIFLTRNYGEAAVKCSLILLEIEKLNGLSDDSFPRIKNEIIKLMDELKFLIEIETRYILFPLPEIKKEAYEMGKKYMSNFLEWIKPDHTPEKIIGILEDDNYRLDEMKDILEKVEFKKEY